MSAPKKIDDLERLLKMKQGELKVVDADYVPAFFQHSSPDRLVAEKNASFDDFIEMLADIISKTMKKDNVEFKPDEGIRLRVDQSEDIDHPYIFFKLVSCDPMMEIKPRIREMGVKGMEGPNVKSSRTAEISGQWFHVRVQFDIFAKGYKEATKVMNIFEDVVYTYTAHFMRKGVKGIRFVRRLTDSNYDEYRQKCSVRSFQYDVDVEKLFSRFDTEIQGVLIR